MCCSGPLRCPSCGNTEGFSCSIDTQASRYVRKYRVSCPSCGSTFYYTVAT